MLRHGRHAAVLLCRSAAQRRVSHGLRAGPAADLRHIAERHADAAGAADYEAGREPRAMQAHGASWTDPYSWMEGGGSAFVTHLNAEGQRTAAALEPLSALRRQLLAEMLASLPVQQVPLLSASSRLGMHQAASTVRVDAIATISPCNHFAGACSSCIKASTGK